LYLAEGVGAKLTRRLVEAFGGVQAAAGAAPAVLGKVKGIGPKTVEALRAVTEQDIDEELDLASTMGVTLICIEDETYPAALKNIHDPPPLLYVRGRLDPTDAVSLGIVGSRRCTHYGAEQAERFGSLLGRAGLTVISGGARGIDTAAHRGALSAGGRTIAVMGCGLAETYPPENKDLFEQIVAEDRGALVAELPLRTAVLSGNFPMRNRVISGLSLGTLVVEAAVPSGALITARTALEQGRELFAVPGRVDSPMSAGTHQLLRDGAHLAADLDDILNALDEVGKALRDETPGDSPEQPVSIPQGLDETEHALLAALGREERSIDELAQAAGVSPGQAAASLTMLMLKGHVRQKPGNRFLRKRT
jgi:DNA processing protein